MTVKLRTHGKTAGKQPAQAEAPGLVAARVRLAPTRRLTADGHDRSPGSLHAAHRGEERGRAQSAPHTGSLRLAGDGERPADLLRAAVLAAGEELPQRAALERAFGLPLGDVRVQRGPDAQAALAALGAPAATYAGQILLGEGAPDIHILAHEVVHVLQARRTGVGAGDDGAIYGSAPLAAEREAQMLARRADLRAAQAVAPATLVPLQPQAEIAAGRVALFSDGPSQEPAPKKAQRKAQASTASPVQANAGAASGAAKAAEGAASAGAAGGAAGVALLEAPNPPPSGLESEGGAEQAAAEQAAAAQAALESAGTATGVVDAFAAASPTLKALMAGRLGERINGVLAGETQTLQAETPPIEAHLAHDAPPVTDELQVTAPSAPPVTLEEQTPAAAPVELAPVPEPGRFEGNNAVGNALTRAQAAEGDRSSQLNGVLDSVQTSDPGIPTRPTEMPQIPLEEATDPARLQSQEEEGRTQAREQMALAQANVVSGPGPERVQPVAVDETHRIEELAAPTVTPAAAPEDAQAYLAMGLPPEVQAAFDQQNGPAMQESVAGAQGQIAQATADRDQQHQEQVQSAEQQNEALLREADQSQRDRVAEARTEIQSERQRTLDDQAAAVQNVETEAETRSRDERGAIDTRVQADQAAVERRYDETDQKARAEVQSGEREAQERQARAEREAEEQSWWDRAVNFVRDAFDALVSAIGSIFDAVRRAVNALLDAARDFAIGLINAATKFIQDAIAAFGAFLTTLVQELLGDIFPELAARLTAAINTLVTAAQEAVGAVAERLRQGVNALVEGLRAGLNAIIDTFQAAVNGALAVLEAVVTGDWSGLARRVLEAVLSLLGIDPQAFYSFIGQVQETFQLIVDDPGGFLGNVLGAVVGGIQKFADNFLQHLQAGIIGWLTGALGGAGITLPERWDLMGVLSLVQQILGLTWQNLRERVVRLVGERAVQALEFVASYVETLVTGGWGALWERIKSDLSTLADMVFDQIRNFLVERVVLAAIQWLASFNPIGGIVKIVMTVYNFFLFLRDQLQRIFAVAQTVIGALADIARGTLDTAILAVESVLAGLLPIVIDLLARILGLGDVGGKVREILQSIQATIWGAIDRLIQSVLASFRGGGTGAAGSPQPVGAGADAAGVGAGAAGMGAGAGGIMGERLPLRPSGQSEHALYIRTVGADATLVVESSPRSVGQLHKIWTDQLPRLPNQPPERKQDTASALLKELKSGNTEAEQGAEQQLAQAPPAGAPPAKAPAAKGSAQPTAKPPAKGPAAKGSAAQPASAPPAPAPNVLTYERNLASVLTRLFELFGGHETAGTAASADILRRWDYELRIAEPSAAQQLFNTLTSEASALQGIESWGQVLAKLRTSETFYRKPLLAGTFGDTVHRRIQSEGAANGDSISEAFQMAKEQYEQRKQLEREAKRKGYKIELMTRRITPPEDVNDFIKRSVGLIHTEPPRAPFSGTLEALRAWVVDRARGNQAMKVMAQEYVDSFPLYYGTGGPTHALFEPLMMTDAGHPTIRYRYRALAGPEFEVTEFDVTAQEGKRARTILGKNLQLKWARSEIARGSRGETNETYKENYDFNTAHLIADQFLGSGYKDSLNTVTTSEYYNQVCMRGIEKQITAWIMGFKKPDVSLRSITFDMQVTATWGPPIMGDGILAEIREKILSKLPANSPARQEFVADFAETHRRISAAGAEINRLLSVVYNVQVYVNGQKQESPPPFTLGPDIYLGMDADVLNRLFPRDK